MYKWFQPASGSGQLDPLQLQHLPPAPTVAMYLFGGNKNAAPDGGIHCRPCHHLPTLSELELDRVQAHPRRTPTNAVSAAHSNAPGTDLSNSKKSKTDRTSSDAFAMPVSIPFFLEATTK